MGVILLGKICTSGPRKSHDLIIGEIRSIDTHPVIAQRVQSSDICSEHESAQKEAGICCSDLLRLPYCDIVHDHLVDPMHTLF